MFRVGLAAAGVTHLLVGPSDLSFMARPEWSAWQPVWNGAGDDLPPQLTGRTADRRHPDRRRSSGRRDTPALLARTTRVDREERPGVHRRLRHRGIPRNGTSRPTDSDVPTSVSADGLLRAAVPAGTTTIEAEFVRDWADYLGVAITGLGLLFVAGTWVRGQRRGRSPEHPYDDEHDDERNAADGALGPVDELEPVER